MSGIWLAALMSGIWLVARCPGFGWRPDVRDLAGGPMSGIWLPALMSGKKQIQDIRALNRKNYPDTILDFFLGAWEAGGL